MFGWLAKRRISEPPSAFLLGDDFETLWRLSFRWCNREAPTAEPFDLPNDVREMVYRLIRGFFKGDITLRVPNGHKAYHKPLEILLWDCNAWRTVLWKCLEGEFNVAFLSNLYVERSQVLSWCEAEQLPLPGFWTKNAGKEAGAKKLALENRIRDDEVDRLVCQSIARVYWDMDPNIHPAHMATTKAIKLYGNGKLYKDENTVKGWIAEVDPRKGERKTGRPEKIPYRIDLETGRLAD